MGTGFHFRFVLPSLPSPTLALAVALCGAVLAAGCTAAAPDWEPDWKPHGRTPASSSAAVQPQSPPAPDTERLQPPPGPSPQPADRRPTDRLPTEPLTSVEPRAPQAMQPAWADHFATEPPFADAHLATPYLEGIASWYGPTFHGKPTASGEIYNQFGLTAAHPMLPMGTKILVENLENGRRVWVRINDRGPYKKGRVLDLSKVAANQLDMLQAGTAFVRITVLRWPEDIQPELGLKAYRQFVVQVAADHDPFRAEARRRSFHKRFPWAKFHIDRAPGSAFTVISGPYDDGHAANRTARRLQEAGVTCLVRSYRK